MEQSEQNAATARQVELIIRRLSSLSTLPSVAAKLLSQIPRVDSLPSVLGEIIESDAALTAKILSLAYSEGIVGADEKVSVSQVLAKLPAAVVRDAILAVKVFQAFDTEYDPDEGRILPRKQLVLHSLATACCARGIAEIVLAADDVQAAFLGGLLHDIGKFALAETMPKSFERIVGEAKSRGVCVCTAEQRHLGLDHTIVGKRLAEKWHLPGQIVRAIWLHHSDMETISAGVSDGKFAQVIRLADLMARSCNIGESGSYEPVENEIVSIAQGLSLKDEQMGEIRRWLAGEVEKRSELLGLEMTRAAIAYYDTVRDTAVQLSQDNRKLSAEKDRLTRSSTHLDFITDFLTAVNSNTSAVDAAGNFAVRWQRFYQTGPVCVYVVSAPEDKVPEAVVVDRAGHSEAVILKAPQDLPAVPVELQNKFTIMNARGQVDWLFEQLDVDFDPSKSKIAPLLSHGKAVGCVVFELSYPMGGVDDFSKFAAVASIGSSVIGLALAHQGQKLLAERFAELLRRFKEAQEQLTECKLLMGLAEVAGGAAHEVNSPLSLISGRAQLLEQIETDPEKKRIVKQIQERAEEIAGIISDLMNFARPAEPRPSVFSLGAAVNQAISETARKFNVPALEVEMENVEELNVFADFQQVVSAIAHILCNALESYANNMGPIRIVGDYDEPEDCVRLQITDLGCGMSGEVLEKATKPFFSDKPAGRKRGMGLAHAQRLVQLNKGFLRIASEVGQGTTAALFLPCKEVRK